MKDVKKLVEKAEAGSPADVRKALTELAKNVDVTYIYIGKFLKQVSDQRLWEWWAYDTFGEYVEDELSFKYRKARYLIGIVEKFLHECGLKQDDLAGIPYSKLAQVAPAVTKTNVQKWLKIAREKTIGQLKETMATKRTEKRALPWSVYLYPEQRDNVENAIAEGLDEAGTESRGHALDVICLKYLASNPGAKKADVRKRLGAMLKSIAKTYSMDEVVAFETRGDQVDWAKKVLAKEAKSKAKED